MRYHVRKVFALQKVVIPPTIRMNASIFMLNWWVRNQEMPEIFLGGRAFRKA